MWLAVWLVIPAQAGMTSKKTGAEAPIFTR
jgi:hypothetical protein